MTLKVTQGHQNCLYSIGHMPIYHFLLVVCSNNDYLAPFTFTGYMTSCDLKKSFIFEKMV